MSSKSNKDKDSGKIFFLDPRWLRFSAALSAAVSVKAVLIYASYRFGSWLDYKWGTYPVFMFFFVVAAVAIGLWYIFYVVDRVKF